jgi:hypothetical protein
MIPKENPTKCIRVLATLISMLAVTSFVHAGTLTYSVLSLGISYNGGTPSNITPSLENGSDGIWTGYWSHCYASDGQQGILSDTFSGWMTATGNYTITWTPS